MKKTIKLNEQALRKTIKESVHSMLNEIGDTPQGRNVLYNAYMKRADQTSPDYNYDKTNDYLDWDYDQQHPLDFEGYEMTNKSPKMTLANSMAEVIDDIIGDDKCGALANRLYEIGGDKLCLYLANVFNEWYKS